MQLKTSLINISKACRFPDLHPCHRRPGPIGLLLKSRINHTDAEREIDFCKYDNTVATATSGNNVNECPSGQCVNYFWKIKLLYLLLDSTSSAKVKVAMSWSTLKFRTTRNVFPQLTRDVAWKRQRSVSPHPGCIPLHRVEHASNAIDLAYVRNIQSSWSCTGEKIIELLVWLCGKYRSTNNNLDGLLISNILHSISVFKTMAESLIMLFRELF